MELENILGELGGVESIAKELGLSQQQAKSGAEALIPAILGGFKKQAQSQASGLGALGGLLGQLGGSGLLDEVLGSQPTDVSRGNNVLGEIFGSKDVSRAVAQHAASKSGVDASVLRKMLPMLAMLVGGYMAKQNSGGAKDSTPAASDLLGNLAGGLLGGANTGGSGGIASMLDLDGDGNPLDDILRVAGKALR